MARILVLFIGLGGEVLPAQATSVLLESLGQDSIIIVQSPDTGNEDALGGYVPGPELSPSKDFLLFDGMLPGESRTLFMDVANLGEGIIVLDSLSIPTSMVEMTLPLQTILPGQFVRFPVTFTQVDLDTHYIEVMIHWRSPRFRTDGTLSLALSSTPRPPLRVVPSEVVWGQTFTGMENSARIVLQNVGTRAIMFPSGPAIPQEVRLSPLPIILVGERSASLEITWLPFTPGEFIDQIAIPYSLEGAEGSVEVALKGLSLQPAYFMQDTLKFGKIFAGSRYHRRVIVGNGSGQTIILNRWASDLHWKGETPWIPGAGEPEEWFVLPRAVEVPPGDTALLDIILSPPVGGRYLAEVTYHQQILTRRDREPIELPELFLTIAAEVDLPLRSSTRQIDFGDQPVLKTMMMPVEVENAGISPLSISVGLIEESEVFSTPPLAYDLDTSDRLAIPFYFRPVEMIGYSDTLVLRYTTFGVPQDLKFAVSGLGIDRPLLRLETIPDVSLFEDFSAPYPIVDLSRIFVDANHRISYRIYHAFDQALHLSIDDNGWLLAAGIPDYHGGGDVVVEAVNELDHVVADTFRVQVAPVNDLPRVAAPVPDLVLREDPAPVVIGNLSEIFHDPDRTLDTVVTHYAVYSPSSDDAVRLSKEGTELVLTVAPDWFGERSFILSARDADDTSVVVFDAFKVTILPVNDPPILTDLPALLLAEDDTAHLSLDAYTRDVDNSLDELAFTFQVEGGVNPLHFEQVGSIAVIRPRVNWYGKALVQLTVTDPSGGAASRKFPVSVTPVNDPPGTFRILEPVTLEWDQRLRYTGRDTLVTFKWETSANLDPGDALRYTWQLMDTSRRVLRELPAGSSTSLTVYMDSAGIFLWSVLARDDAGVTTASDMLPLVLESLSSAISDGDEDLTFTFGPNYPNPFSDRTRIEYTIPKYSRVVIVIYDAMGRKVRVLRSETQYRGRYTVDWDGRDNHGQRVASGPYVAEIRAGAYSAYLKLVVVH